MAQRKSFVGGLLARRECAEQWQEFVSTTLAQELGRQMNPLGGFAVPSREDENQLSTDFPDEVMHLFCFWLVVGWMRPGARARRDRSCFYVFFGGSCDGRQGAYLFLSGSKPKELY